ncbi:MULTISPECIES: metallophosphoesterase [unclassified Sinorhizobium]|uniref:metallophosphoesterase family protein n=1 Tax=unclassified Sinorhizobium TaxID=2613772 RepID=UPI0024C2D6B8|nr:MULTISPECIES: metallophosphoesterase [unclassified Sinorhizobium]MDK1374929.1 metallophosphoesterase [Sinorhizobium sp. 6-70]MDK1478375.1 metallophosphoesterase [Sinorhizobium sp. 6-117]
MFKLAHISDVHLGPLPDLSLRELASKRITGFVNWHRNRARHLFAGTLDCLMADIQRRHPDHLAITGDLVNLASSLEIAAVTAWLAEAGDAKDISVVPGNHDAYVPGAYEKTTRAWYPYMRSDEGPLGWIRDHHCFPYVRVRGPVAIIGCSTAVATPPFAASGYFGQRQARATVDLLQAAGEAGLFRVVLIHHPPIRGATSMHKRMIGIRRFAATISSGGAELVLHGHTHLNTVYYLKGQTAPVPVVGIASASQGPGGSKPAAAYNLFSVAGESGNWQLSRERYTLNADATGVELAETTLF